VRKWVVCVLLMFFWVGIARGWNLSLLVNDKNLDFNLKNMVLSYSGTPVYLGSEFLFAKKEGSTSWLLSPYFMVTDFYKKPVDMGLGFGSYWGRVSLPNDEKAGVITLGFWFEGKVDIQRLFAPLPLTFITKLYYAPEILSFDQAEGVLSGDFSLNWNLNSSASLVLDYKIVDINTTKTENWHHYALLLGASISF